MAAILNLCKLGNCPQLGFAQTKYVVLGQIQRNALVKSFFISLILGSSFIFWTTRSGNLLHKRIFNEQVEGYESYG